MSRQIVYSIEEMIATITANRPERVKPLAHEHRGGQRLGHGRRRLLATLGRYRAAVRRPRSTY